MSLVINSNSAATAASNFLAVNTRLLEKSLGHLSSGFRIQNPSDDAGGLAVSMKMQAAIKRTDALITNLANAVSLLQTQEGAMNSATALITRMSELCSLNGDPAKSIQDKANYNTEFLNLQGQLNTLLNEKFNGVFLFQAGGATKTVIVAESGSEHFEITLPDLENTINAIVSAANLNATSIVTYTTALQNLATQRAQNGAETNRLDFASQVLMINRTNLEAANSRIIDTDIAGESTRFARYNILVQSGSAMLSQANTTYRSVLRLLS
jgi:flagellin